MINIQVNIESVDTFEQDFGAGQEIECITLIGFELVIHDRRFYLSEWQTSETTLERCPQGSNLKNYSKADLHDIWMLSGYDADEVIDILEEAL